MGDNVTKKKSVKNIYDKDSGFSIRINLYVIKYIYYHIKKASRFIDVSYGRKSKSIPVYGTTGFPVSRQRFNRIIKGYPFEFTRSEANEVTETYGIDIKYFRKDDPVPFEVGGLSETDWICYYNKRHNAGYELSQRFDKEDIISKKDERVKNTLAGLTADWERTLEKDDPIYAICYYFCYGERLDKLDITGKLKANLSILEYEKWDRLDMGALKEIRQLMKNHYQYIDSLIILRSLRQTRK